MKKLSLIALLAAACSHAPVHQPVENKPSLFDQSKENCASTLVSREVYQTKQGKIFASTFVNPTDSSFDAMYLIGDEQTQQVVYLYDVGCDGTLNFAQRCDVSDSPKVCGHYTKVDTLEPLHAELVRQLNAAMKAQPHSLSQASDLYEKVLQSPVKSAKQDEPTKAMQYGPYQLLRIYADVDEDGEKEYQYAIRRVNKVVLLQDKKPFGSIDMVVACDHMSADDLFCAPSTTDGTELYKLVASVLENGTPKYTEDFNTLFFQVLNGEVMPEQPQLKTLEL